MSTTLLGSIEPPSVTLAGAASGDQVFTDQLLLEDKTALTQHLNIIANDSGWPQASVDAANAILSKPQYSAAAWENFFGEYFATQPFTDSLSNYLGYPTFFWFDESVHFNLQTGLIRPLMQLNVIPDWDAAIGIGENVFAVDPTLMQDLYHSQDMLTSIATRDVVTPELKQELFDVFATLINNHASVMKSSVTLDSATQPYFGILRTQAALAYLAAANSSDSVRPSFNPTIKAQIASTLDLRDEYADLWNNFTLLYIDNNLSSIQQRATVQDLLGSVPAQLHNTAVITVDDLLGNTTAFQARTLAPIKPYGGINIFGLDVGDSSENSFPNDVPIGMVDVFSIALAHELNHVVDALTVQRSSVLADRRQALIDGAGSASLNYLRSTAPDGFFQSTPQEFFASIANQWFTSSSKTFDLALSRFDAGRREPINQALFFAEIYSEGGDRTVFYEMNTTGVLTRYEVPIGRNANGFINELTYNGQKYVFDLDTNGNVVDYTTTEVPSGRITITLTEQPTSTDSLGQVNSVPDSLPWLDEWRAAWLEIWVRAEALGTGGGITSASAVVEFHRDYFSVGSPSGGSAFGTFTGSVDLPGGRVYASGDAPVGVVGVDQYVLLARFPIGPAAPGGGVPIRVDRLAPVEPLTGSWISLAEDGSASIDFGGETLLTRGDPPPKTHLFPMLYDLSDDQRIGFGDFSLFASSFLAPASRDATSAKSDFNLDGVVNFGDFSLFAANFLMAPGGSISYPANFPQAWESPAGMMISTLASSAAASAKGVSIDMLQARSRKSTDTRSNEGLYTSTAAHVIRSGLSMISSQIVGQTDHHAGGRAYLVPKSRSYLNPAAVAAVFEVVGGEHEDHIPSVASNTDATYMGAADFDWITADAQWESLVNKHHLK